MTSTTLDTGTAPVLILLHGAGGNQAMWNPVRRHLDPRWRVVALDLPGHGSKSDSHFTLEGAVETVAAEVRRLAPARVALVGDSLGGYTSMASALALPTDRVAGLAIGGCTQNIAGKTLRQLRTRKVMMRMMAALLGPKRLIAKSSAALVKKGLLGPDDVNALVAGGLRLAAWGEAVDSLGNRDFLADVPKIAAPILFINGDKDAGPVAGEAEFLAAARHADVARFPCEHGVSLWLPAEFAGAVNRFVERLALKEAA
ncbi:alpha/beta fold hydrolase [Scleromatobacter humisilvae]|uniref:Alpha/beta hydrolase n=1 Tax=Scleromatobacter humisilvae TaxID=2897159 RepID=A0A9X1YPT1_9BURK|nr:alpha/beta hydrolase [Scleromatobacter humisilvae]MCK9688858.1 alpha/beta hydrolase [Scleromatobacter humisilvae]